MKGVLKQPAPSFLTVHQWFLESERGRTNVEDEPRRSQRKTTTTPGIIEQVNN